MEHSWKMGWCRVHKNVLKLPEVFHCHWNVRYTPQSPPPFKIRSVTGASGQQLDFSTLAFHEYFHCRAFGVFDIFRNTRRDFQKLVFSLDSRWWVGVCFRQAPTASTLQNATVCLPDASGAGDVRRFARVCAHLPTATRTSVQE